MIEVWENVLDEANISLEDDFFDLGGTSIYAIKLCARLAKDFNSAITIADLFEYPTPRELLEFIDKENLKIAS